MMSTQRLEQLLDFLEKDPSDSFLLFAIAREYENLGNRQEALAYYTRLTGQDPDYVGVYYHLGKLYEKLGQPEQALDTYQKGMTAARQAGDQHALNELAAARFQLEENN